MSDLRQAPVSTPAALTARIDLLQHELQRLQHQALSPRSTAPRALLVFHVRGSAFAVDLASTAEVLRMVAVTPLAQSGPALLGVIDCRGRMLPIFDPASRLALERRPPGLDSKIIVVATAGHLLGLVCDEVEGLQEVAPEDLEARDDLLPPGAPKLPSCVIATVRRDAGLLLVLDVLELLSPEERHLAASLTSASCGGDTPGAARG